VESDCVIRLLVSDIDGTLVRPDKSLGEPVITAARALIDAGVTMSLISARPASGMIWIAKALGLTAPLAAFNGGTILRPNGEILAVHRLDPEDAKQALALIERPEIMTWLFHADRWHAGRLDEVHVPRERKAANQEPVVGADFSTLLDAVDKIVAVSDDHDLLARLETEVGAALGDRATVSRSQPYYLDITAPAANKGAGIEALARSCGIALTATAAIGDQRNDMAMFAKAGLSIAMGQAPEQVRAAADRVTGSDEADGVAQAIDRILLPMIGARTGP
jgi:Cof subfamily protein (haloacid dehalogenase superfamily)